MKPMMNHILNYSMYAFDLINWLCDLRRDVPPEIAKNNKHPMICVKIKKNLNVKE